MGETLTIGAIVLISSLIGTVIGLGILLALSWAVDRWVRWCDKKWGLGDE